MTALPAAAFRHRDAARPDTTPSPPSLPAPVEWSVAACIIRRHRIASSRLTSEMTKQRPKMKIRRFNVEIAKMKGPRSPICIEPGLAMDGLK